MKYSIVIPVYKSSKTLSLLNEELHSVMKSTETDFEIIYVDDCSPDDSWAVLRQLKDESGKIRILRLGNNAGQWMATLAGISRSTGNYIITIDDDLEYVTADILKLIEHQSKHNWDIVYGIPTEKQNKDLSYKLFFKARNAIMHVFFNKLQTESFKIFRREIYFDEHGKMRSNLHFEALTKFAVAENNTSHIDVGYQPRHSGQSNHTLWMKIRMLDKYGIEYFKSPFRLLIYAILIFGVFIVLQPIVNTPAIFQQMLKILILVVIAFYLGILGKYLSSTYFKIKGLPEFFIVEEY